MKSGLLKKKNQDPSINKDLEDLFARPIKKVVDPEPEITEVEVMEGLEQEGDENLSAVQIKVRSIVSEP
mgnify:CR=1 FL=1|jgi:hypothetical protein